MEEAEVGVGSDFKKTSDFKKLQRCWRRNLRNTWWIWQGGSFAGPPGEQPLGGVPSRENGGWRSSDSKVDTSLVSVAEKESEGCGWQRWESALL